MGVLDHSYLLRKLWGGPRLNSGAMCENLAPVLSADRITLRLLPHVGL